jgi:hypothetical protein
MQERTMDQLAQGFAAQETHEELLGLSTRSLRLRCGAATHQHFKGGLYRYLGPLFDSETGERALDAKGRPLVVYEHVYPHARQIWKRSEEEFFGMKDGAPRFRRLC